MDFSLNYEIIWNESVIYIEQNYIFNLCGLNDGCQQIFLKLIFQNILVLNKIKLIIISFVPLVWSINFH